MARGSNLYYDYWKKQVPDFLEDMKEGYVEYDMPEESFKKRGNRQDYSFRLDIQNGLVVNNIGGSAVARDLFEALNDNSEFRKFAQGKNITFKMDSNFVLYIEVN